MLILDCMAIVMLTIADWGSNLDRRSISGFGFQFNINGPLISWKSRKQQCVSLSTCEAEYVALSAATQEAKFLKQLYYDLSGGQDRCVVIYGDNQGSLALANSHMQNQRSKHIDIRYHYIRSEIESKTIELKYIPTQDNLADIFTKPVSKNKILKFLNFG